jgi:hypothetical protein
MLDYIRQYKILFSLIVILFVSYWNYILNNGFGSGDDISLLIYVGNNDISFIDSFIRSYFNPTSIARPISTFLRVLTFKIFQENLFFYNFTSFFIWLMTILILSLSIKKLFGNTTRLIFILLGSFPFYSSTIFFENYVFTSYMASIFFWSLSLFFLIKYSEKKNKKDIFFGIFFTIISMLTLEYVLPLLLLNIFFPLINNYRLNLKNNVSIKNILNQNKFIYVLLFFILLFFIFKILSVKIIFGDENVYGFSFNGMDSILQSLYYFVVIFIELPILLLKSLFYLLEIKYFIILLLLSIFYLALGKINKSEKPIILKKNLFFYVLVLSLFGCSIIFFLSYYPSTSYGYYNRMMVPSFILLSIITSVIFQKILNSKKILNAIIVIFISLLWISSLNIQIDNYVKSWKLRDNILNNISKEIEKIDDINNTVLILNAPYHLSKNYNNEHVFFTTWNLQSHIYLLTAKKILSFPVSHRIINDANYYPSHNINNFKNKIKDKKFIYIKYIENGNLTVNKIANYEELKSNFEDMKKKKINDKNIILREKIRIELIKLIRKIKNKL